MNPALYYKIYGDRVNKEIILRYIEYFKSYYLPCLIKNYVRRVKPKVKS